MTVENTASTGPAGGTGTTGGAGSTGTGHGGSSAETEADERVFRFYGEIEQELRSAVRSVLAEKCPLTDVAWRFDHPDPAADRALWSVLGGSLGTAGLLVPEADGGAGATAREAAVVLEEIGRAVAPVPFLTSAVWATTLLAECPGAASSGVLERLASGEAIAAVAARADTVPGSVFTDSVISSAGGVGGAVSSVIGARDAGVFVVPATSGGVSALVLVEAEAGVRRTPVVSLDESRPLTDLVFEDVPGAVLVTGAAAEAAFEKALVTASALLASEQLGVAERCLEETVAYVKTRHQFGRPIGSFQAVKHRLADLWAQVEGARTAARYAATCAAIGSPDLQVAAALAASYCSQAAVKAAEECVQLHGGIGFTWEHPAHLWLKRAMAQAVLFGGPERQRARLGALVGLEAPTV